MQVATSQAAAPAIVVLFVRVRPATCPNFLRYRPSLSALRLCQASYVRKRVAEGTGGAGAHLSFFSKVVEHVRFTKRTEI